MSQWYSKYLQVYEKPFSEARPVVVEEIRGKIAKLQSESPVVTVSLIGYNEEKHLLACLWSLSEMECKYPVEIIGVDNESKDRTAEIFQACGVPYYTETRHSCGFCPVFAAEPRTGKVSHQHVRTRCTRPGMWRRWWMRWSVRVWSG